MKQREYKNFAYALNRDNSNVIYYVCNKGCGGTIHYTKRSIVEHQKHACVDTGKVIDLMAVCNIHY